MVAKETEFPPKDSWETGLLSCPRDTTAGCVGRTTWIGVDEPDAGTASRCRVVVGCDTGVTPWVTLLAASVAAGVDSYSRVGARSGDTADIGSMVAGPGEAADS